MSSPLAANTVDAAALADELARFRVLDPDRLTGLLAEFPGGGPAALAEFLVRRGVLTPYQADRALSGETRALALGPYRITGHAGLGAFGPLFAATHRDKPGDFRIRVFPLRSVWRARQAKQLARTLAAAQHPAVVPLVDADSANGSHYLVWPQVEGETLADRVAATGPLPVNEVIGLLAFLAEVLHTCHVCKIVHGALTPRSVLIGTYGEPRLLELGAGAILAANLADDESLLDTLSGSHAATGVIKFAAPEYVHESTVSPAGDQYSLGAIGYYALTGDAPFATASLRDCLTTKATGQPHPLGAVNPTIPVDLIGIIERMLHPDKDKRFLGLDEVQDRLAEIDYVPAPSEHAVPSGGGSTANPTPSPASGNATTSATESEAESANQPSFDRNRSKLAANLPTGPFALLSVPGPGTAATPARDDSDASIDFELPPSEPGPSPAIAPPIVAAMPSQSDRETENVWRKDTTGTPVNVGNSPRPTTAVGPLAKAPMPLAATAPVSNSGPERLLPPTVRMSVVKPTDPRAEKSPTNDAAEGVKRQISGARTVPDQRTSVSTPVLYHTESLDDAEPGMGTGAAPAADDRPVTDSVLWRKVKRNLLFWQASLDAVHVSIFGPVKVAPGASAKLSVFLHTSETTESVRTLARAFQHDSELIGSGLVSQEVARETELGVHLSLANAGISKTLQTVLWRGQPHRLVFELQVPWETRGGPTPGLVSIGRENVRIGKVEFRLQLLPRTE